MKFRNIKLIKKIKSIILVSIILNLIKKNLKLIIRSKSSALVVLLGPLLITILVASAFNTSNLYDIKVGVYSSSYSELSDSLINNLKDKFSVLKIENEEKCINDLKYGKVHICAVFPANLDIGSKEDIKFYVDQSRINLVWIIIDTLSKKVSMKTEEISLQLTTVIIDTLNEAKNKIASETGVLESISNKNKETSSKIEELRTNLNLLDFDSDDIKVEEIKEKLDEVIISGGFDSLTFSSVYNVIEEVKNETKEIESKFKDRLDKSMLSIAEIDTAIDDNDIKIVDVKSTLESVKNKINEIGGISAETVVSPIKTSVKPLASKSTHLSFIFPTLIVMVIMFIGLLLSSILVVREKTAASYFRNFITPVKDWIFLTGDYITNIIILCLQLVIIFIVAMFFFKTSFMNVLGSSFVVVLVLASVFILLGTCIGYLFKSEETSTMAAVAIGAILLFFSSTVLPIETLPGFFKNIAEINPFVIGESLLNKIMIYNAKLGTVLEGIGMLLMYIIIFGSLVYITQKVSKRSI